MINKTLLRLSILRNFSPSSIDQVYLNQIANKTGKFTNTTRNFGSYIEEYYTTNHASTGFSSPLRKSFAYMVIIIQTTLTFGFLLHTNYYFTGKALPKADGQTQLCSDSK